MLSSFSLLATEIWVTIAFILGLLVGSFLNVVIYRLPKRMQFEWTQQSYEWLNKEPYSTVEEPPGIVFPASHCGHCKTPIKAWQNIPVVSFLLLKGRCGHCQQSISWRYPAIELLTAILSAYVMYHFGWSLQALFGLLLTWALVALTFIDFDHQLLPDDIVFPTLWLGLGLSTYTIFTQPSNAIIGAIAGYLSLWCVFQLFKLLTGKEGMGFGDFKLLSLFGAWFGWQVLPQIVLLSTLLGSIVGLTLIITGNTTRDKPMPFGPYLAIAGWVAMLWGEQINQLYLTSIGL